MNKKGFTLIELLSSITIMGLIATITSINIVKIFDHGCTISTNTLIKSGLLKEDDVDKGTFINIYKENNQKMCTIRKEENNG